ncbi:MAG: glycosyltransferase [archaeon]|nr:glycosyltransferase [archaeon]MCP8321858.1 glycosyltransferase [archaeon]
MKKLRICVNNQTPLVRFKLGYPELLEKYGTLIEPIDLRMLVEGEDYEYTPGGVTAMVYPLLKRMIKEGIIAEPHWVSLGPNAPSQVLVNGMMLYNVSLEDRDIPLYSNFKEGIWQEIHGLSQMQIKPSEYEAYTRYNWVTAQLLLKILPEVDLFWIHDFQQLQIGNLIGPSAPAILRWHIPFHLENLSKRLRTFILKNIEAFDAMIVSTRRDLEGLISAGYRGKAYQIYPSLEPDKWDRPSNNALNKFKDRFKLKENFLLLVARMDVIKGQDIAIKALSLLKDWFPGLKLVLVGDGSFTSSGAGGLSHPKGFIWRKELQKLAKELKVEDSVVFTGYSKDEELKAAYTLADAVIVTSHSEGFNLTTIEGWLYRKPVIVSRGAGSSELVNEGVNGYTFDPQNPKDLTEKIGLLLMKKEASIKMGENGFYTSRQCYVDNAVKRLAGIFDEVIKQF